MPVQNNLLTTQATTVGATSVNLIGIAINPGDTLAIDIVVISTDDTGNALVSGITALYVNIAGIITLVGSSKQKSITNTVSKNWNVTASVDQPNNTVNIAATGAIGNTVRWALDGSYATLPLGQ